MISHNDGTSGARGGLTGLIRGVPSQYKFLGVLVICAGVVYFIYALTLSPATNTPPNSDDKPYTQPANQQAVPVQQEAASRQRGVATSPEKHHLGRDAPSAGMPRLDSKETEREARERTFVPLAEEQQLSQQKSSVATQKQFESYFFYQPGSIQFIIKQDFLTKLLSNHHGVDITPEQEDGEYTSRIDLKGPEEDVKKAEKVLKAKLKKIKFRLIKIRKQQFREYIFARKELLDYIWKTHEVIIIPIETSSWGFFE
eukprot:260648_1